jgi:hypothetical protein
VQSQIAEHGFDHRLPACTGEKSLIFVAEKESRTLLYREQGEIIKLSMITKGYVRNMFSNVEIATLE